MSKPFEQSNGPAESTPAEVRVFKLEEGSASRQVSNFEFAKIEKPGHGNYQDIKTRYGALAATDADRKARTQKDERFVLNPMSRDRMAIEDEERRAIQAKVDERIKAELVIAQAQAHREGFEAGRTEGKAEALGIYSQEGAARIAKLDQLLAEFEGARDQILAANERFLVELVFRISRMLMLKDLSADPEYVLRLAKLLIERVGVRDNIRIRINPAEKASLELLRSNLDQTFGGLKNLNIEASQRVSSGGCVIETDWNLIDATVETQLKGIYASLVGEGVAASPVTDAPPTAGKAT